MQNISDSSPPPQFIACCEYRSPPVSVPSRILWISSQHRPLNDQEDGQNKIVCEASEFWFNSVFWISDKSMASKGGPKSCRFPKQYIITPIFNPISPMFYYPPPPFQPIKNTPPKSMSFYTIMMLRADIENKKTLIFLFFIKLHKITPWSRQIYIVNWEILLSLNTELLVVKSSRVQ